MNELTVDFRRKIHRLEEALIAIGGTMDPNDGTFPLHHHFIEGVYMRQFHGPAGSAVVGRIHNVEQIHIILKGEVSVYAEDGVKRIVAPYFWTAPPGSKRAAYFHEDTIWLSIHGVDQDEPEKMIDIITSVSYEDFDRIQRAKPVQLPLLEA